MKELDTVLFYLPYFLLVILLVFITIYFTFKDFVVCYKQRNYLRIAYLVFVTIIAFIVGWIAG